MTIAVWLGVAAPARSSRWLDGALATAVRLGPTVAIAAGAPAWLELAAARAASAGAAALGVATDLSLDYLGTAQIAAAAIRARGASVVLVDEASRPELAAEVGALAELLDAAQLTRVVALARDGGATIDDSGDAPLSLRATRIAAGVRRELRVRGPIVLGVRIAAPRAHLAPAAGAPTAAARVELAELGLDPSVLVHRALPPPSARDDDAASAADLLDRLADRLAAYATARRAP